VPSVRRHAFKKLACQNAIYASCEWRFPAACDSSQRKPHPDQPRGTGAFVHHDGRVSVAPKLLVVLHQQMSEASGPEHPDGRAWQPQMQAV